MRDLVPAVCDVSVTNACNAACDFCGYARHKTIAGQTRWLDADRFRNALPILYRRGIRYINFQGGEPLLHAAIDRMIADTRRQGMRPAVITNGWWLPKKIEMLAAAGLQTLLVSIDSHAMPAHERNRGLQKLGERIAHGISEAHRRGMPVVASVTVSRLVDYAQLPDLLRWLQFDAATFSYPRREPFGSTSLVYGGDSELVDFPVPELIDALDKIKTMSKGFPVLNPIAGIEDIQRHLRGDEERFACVGGHKYFYLDWNLDIWRCESWPTRIGSVFDFGSIPDQRERCTACMMSCYRDTSVLMHAGIAVGDAVRALRAGQLREALAQVFSTNVATSLAAIIREAPTLRRLAGKRHHRTRSG